MIVDERAQGRTIFFSTHILSDVETLCDHVAILRRGEVVVQGALDELLARDVQRVDLVVIDAPDGLDAELAQRGMTTHRVRNRLTIEVEGAGPANELLAELVRRGKQVAAMLPRTETLEQLFVREAIHERDE